MLVGFPGGLVGKVPPAVQQMQETWVQSLGWGIPGRAWQLTPLLLPGEPHGQRNRAGYSSWGRKELDPT